MTEFDIRRLSDSDDRRSFECGVPQLDRYFREKVSQDVRRRLCNCFIAIEYQTGTIAGYYTLSASSIALDLLPEDVNRRLPRYATVPAVLIGRLVVDRSFVNRGLGSSLLYGIVNRCGETAPAAFTLVVDAKNDRAAAFYRKHQFSALELHPMRLFLPMASAQKLFT